MRLIFTLTQMAVCSTMNWWKQKASPKERHWISEWFAFSNADGSNLETFWRFWYLTVLMAPARKWRGLRPSEAWLMLSGAALHRCGHHRRKPTKDDKRTQRRRGCRRSMEKCQVQSASAPFDPRDSMRKQHDFVEFFWLGDLVAMGSLLE